MTVDLTRRLALVGLSLIVFPIRASTAPAAKQKQDEDDVLELERPAVSRSPRAPEVSRRPHNTDKS
jgi:hypothetical protein